MIRQPTGQRSLWRSAALALTFGSTFQLSFLDSCNDRLINATRYVDPCATFLANCAPGSFVTNAADIGDYCVDPTCSVPGGCGNPPPTLGTQTELCP
jgi:hypothetical protein